MNYPIGDTAELVYTYLRLAEAIDRLLASGGGEQVVPTAPPGQPFEQAERKGQRQEELVQRLLAQMKALGIQPDIDNGGEAPTQG